MRIRLALHVISALLIGAMVGTAGTSGQAFAQKISDDATHEVNPYSPKYGHPYRRGAVPTRDQHRLMNFWKATHTPGKGAVDTSKLTAAEAQALSLAATSNTLSYGGGIDSIGVTSGAPKVYLVFWGNQWGTQGAANGYVTFSGDTVSAAPYMQQWLKGLGTNGELWSGVMTQYCDGSVVAKGSTTCPAGSSHISYPTSSVLAGVWYDNSAAAPAAATGNQIAQEAIKAAAYFGNTTAASNRYVQYVIMSPTGTNPDGWLTGGFCAWHDYNGDTTLTGGAATSPYGDIAFTNLPYVADAGASCGAGFVPASVNPKLDGFSIVGGHEYAETITDQNPAGGWYNLATGEENGDECAWISSGQGAAALVAMSTGSFAMQSTWSNDTKRCDLSHTIVSTSGGGTPTANFSYLVSGATASFTDHSTDTGGSIGTHAWSFGDGTTSTTTSPSHTYAASGTYSVTETVTDLANGKSSSQTQSVSVTVPATTNLIGNGGFETNSIWTMSAGVWCTTSTCAGQTPHSGVGFAWLDGYGTTHTDTVSQTVTIPGGKTTATLSLYLHITTLETTASLQHDKLAVAVKQGTTITTLGTFSNLNAASNYVLRSFNVSSFIGSTITIIFTGTEDASLATSFVIDDVSLTAQ